VQQQYLNGKGHLKHFDWLPAGFHPSVADEQFTSTNMGYKVHHLTFDLQKQLSEIRFLRIRFHLKLAWRGKLIFISKGCLMNELSFAVWLHGKRGGIPFR